MSAAEFIRSKVCPHLWDLTPYSSARDEFSGTAEIYLDANENPYGVLNRYPDPHQIRLKRAYSAIKGIFAENLFVGNGSDEVIDLLIRLFCVPGQDSLIILPPTYGMYEVSARINNTRILQVPLGEGFQPDYPAIQKIIEEARAQDHPVKLVFFCSPNNPTGNSLDGIEEFAAGFDGVVVVDEAYADFSERKSLSALVSKYPNVVVMQTLSKSRGLAAARIGFAIAGVDIIQWLNRIKPPYNISLLNQQAALQSLNDPSVYDEQRNVLISERQRISELLKKINGILRIYPSDANFLLVETHDPDRIYTELTSKGIIVRNRNSVVPGCLRITIGTAEENDALIEALNELLP